MLLIAKFEGVELKHLISAKEQKIRKCVYCDFGESQILRLTDSIV